MLCLDRPASVPVVRRVFAGLVGPVQLLNECAYFAKESVRVGCKFPTSALLWGAFANAHLWHEEMYSDTETVMRSHVTQSRVRRIQRVWRAAVM